MNDIKVLPLFKNSAFINGEWKSCERSFHVKNPYNNESLAEVSDCGIDETKQAIDAAHAAFPIWKEYSASKRSRILKNWYGLIRKNSKELGQILTLEQGKPVNEAIGEVLYGASFVEWFAEEAKRIYGDIIPGQSSRNRITVIKQPIGVVGAITPWNFPSAMITRKIAPALAAGCTVVLKPSELTPLSALALAELAVQAGFPPGVINIIPGTDAAGIGKELTSNRKVRKISFTGSTRVGKLLLAQSADQVKKITLELGGNAPFIVFEDADIDLAVKESMRTKFGNAGQTCISSNRIMVHESIHDEFVEKFKVAMQSLQVGDGLKEGVNVGPLINERAALSNQSLIEDAVQKGGQVKSGGKRLEGLLFEPTILTDLTSNMDVFDHEIFGPIAAFYPFKTDEEAVALANDTEYGLAAYFFGRDYARIWKVAEALEYGMVGINTGNISSPAAPFGGIKESGIGTEGSKYGINDYVNIKYMNWNLGR